MAKRPPVGLDRHAIKAEVHRRGTTLTAIAIAANLDPSACRSALLRRHIGGEHALADFLGYRPEEVWPERYTRPSPKAQRILEQRASTSPNAMGTTDTRVAA